LSRALAAAAVVLASMACSNASSPSSGQSPATRPVLRIGYGLTVCSMDPSRDCNGGAIKDISYAPLIHVKPDGTYAPGLATSWRYLDTGGQPNTDFELTLRGDARFSDGEPFNAQAVKGWFEYMVSSHGTWSPQMGPNPTFEAVNPTTLRIHLTQPHPGLPRLLSEAQGWGWVPAPQVIANPSLFPTTPYGAGPYMLDAARSVTNDHYTYVPNPYYYDRAGIRFSEVDVKVILTPSTMLQALQSGQIDVVVSGDLGSADAAAASGFDVVSAPAGTLSMFIADYNGSSVKALGDVRVRQAMNYAIDRTTIAKALFGSRARATTEVVTVDAAEARYQSYYPYDPARAKALLADAGYASGITLKLLDYGPGLANGDLLYQAVAKYEDAVGIHLDITTPPPSASSADIATKSYPLIAISQGLQPTFVLFPQTFPGSPLNPFNSDDPKLDELYQAGLRSPDPSDSWKLLYERDVEQAYFVPLVSNQYVHFVSKHVGGVITGQGRIATVLPQEWYPK
jgi:peptide/nickel transport system substrate-binding protein